MEQKLKIVFKQSFEYKSVPIMSYTIFEFGMHLSPSFHTGIYFMECDLGYGGHMHIPLDNIAYIEELTYREKDLETDDSKTPGHLR